MENKENKITRFQVKAVVFDIQEECKQLKQDLAEAGIAVVVPFFGLQVEQTIKEILSGTGFTFTDCLFLTNHQQHAKLASELGMAVAGCMEGHFEVPKSVTLLEDPAEVSVNYLNQVYCHAVKVPATIAETQRCFIREMTAEDMNSLYEILTDEETAKYLPAKAGTKEEELEKLISYVSCVYSFFGYGYWGVFSKETGELIGRAGFKEGEFPLEAGYVIKRSYWNQGYATEAIKASLDYAKNRLEVSHVNAFIRKGNEASIKAIKKTGFRYVQEAEIDEHEYEIYRKNLI